MATIVAVCSSAEKGTQKRPITEGVLNENHGLAGDAHAGGSMHRQVSLLAIESINKIRSLGFELNPGDFAENLTTEGIELILLPVSTRISVGREAILEITQIGKECHLGCAIFQQIGKCIMPREGVFARVICGGPVKAGDRLRVEKMDNEVAKLPIWQISEGNGRSLEDAVARELPLTIILDDLELVTLLCTPGNLDYLAAGFLFAEGLINSKDEIDKITIDDRRGVVRIITKEGKGLAQELLFKRLITSACGRGAAFYSAADAQHPAKVESRTEISPEEVFALVREFEESSEIYKATGGVHSAALCDTKNILVFSDDLGRHNAIDRVFGECILKGIPTKDRLVITSGRTPSEMVLKVAKGNIPILISISVPTDLSIRLATDLGVTIIGMVRGEKMNIYTGGWRVKRHGK